MTGGAGSGLKSTTKMLWNPMVIGLNTRAVRPLCTAETRPLRDPLRRDERSHLAVLEMGFPDWVPSTHHHKPMDIAALAERCTTPLGITHTTSMTRARSQNSSKTPSRSFPRTWCNFTTTSLSGTGNHGISEFAPGRILFWKVFIFHFLAYLYIRK